MYIRENLLSRLQAELENALESNEARLESKDTPAATLALLIVLVGTQHYCRPFAHEDRFLGFMLPKIEHWFQGALDKYALCYAETLETIDLEFAIIASAIDVAERHNTSQSSSDDVSRRITALKFLIGFHEALYCAYDLQSPEIKCVRRNLPKLIDEFADKLLTD